MDIRQQLLAAFEAEHREHVDAIRAALRAAADGRPADWTDVFRRAHSLKGAARAVDLPPVEALSHVLESLFEQVMAGRPLDRATAGAVDLALDRIEGCVAALPNGTPPPIDDALVGLERCLSATAEPAEAAAPQTAKPKPVELPAPAPAEPVGEVGAAVLRVPASGVEALNRETHALANALAAQSSLSDRLFDLAKALAEVRRTLARDPRAATDAALAALSREALDVARRLRLGQQGVEAVATRVRDETERLALVPAETAFGGFARAVREMAREAGRDVTVSVRGLDLPVERQMLQALRDPVLHALRNAFGHGAETALARSRAGKDAALAILLTVEAHGSRLVIGIHDDGPGPDLRAIEQKAHQRGLLAPGETASADRLLSFVFEPGFSTAEAVDALSGRGIGLSVVAEAVRALAGTVTLEPRQPYGAVLTMRLPLSAARRPVLLVEAGGETYAIPSSAAERVFSLDPAQIETAAGRPVARIPGQDDGTAYPVVRLSRLLDFASPATEPQRLPTVLLRAGTRRCLLVVDALRDVRQLLVLPPPPIGSDRSLLAGTVVLGSDTPVLVLDPEALMARAGDATSAFPQIGTKGYGGERGTMPVKRRSTILVVDDSITTRTLEKSILEAAGYRVVACVDGQDALDRLRAGIEPVDCVVADVEMPRLDGFGLVAALRSEEAFAKLPVVLMTSRGDAADVTRGLELGADAYLTKQRFDQRELLETISQLV